MRTVQLYINDKKVDLFKDEKITITSSTQNIQDISKTFTDFSQSFTVPASDTNNTIFSWYYNNDIDGGFIAKERATARIEINNIPFRRGKVQLEGSTIKNNVPESYKITFYGDIVTLKDLFGTDKLSDLDYSSISFAYTGSTVETTITSASDLNVRFPLISSNRVWQYGDGTAQDISVGANAINYTELFPAIKDKAIIDIIQTQYGVNFNSDFFNGNYFKKSFTWWKNSNEVFFSNEPIALTFNDATQNSPFQNNQVIVQTFPNSFNNIQGDAGETHSFNISVSTSPTCNYILNVYKNGGLLTSIDSGNTTSGTHTILDDLTNIATLADAYTFDVQTYNMSATSTVTGTLSYTYNWWEEQQDGSFDFNTESHSTAYTTGSFASEYNFNITAPNITVAEWFSSILKMFNLTCYPLGTATNYKVEPLMDWYTHGGEVNITEYTDVKSIKVNRPKLYKKISFEYQKSKAFLNEEFRGRLNYDYGNLSLDFSFDGPAFKIKLPFENILFTKFTGQNLQVSYSIDKAVDGKPIIPKPVKLFLDELKNTNVDFYLHNGTGVSQIQQYMPFGQDQVFNGENYTQNFGLEQSTLKDIEITNSLYMTFYNDYISNLFNDKTRKVIVKCFLPLPTLMMLSLDDSILLRDKRYLIDSMKTDLTTGEVDLVLLSDFNRGYIQTIGDYPSVISNEALSLSLLVKMMKPPNPTKQFDGGGGYVTLGATRETQFLTISLPVTLTSDTIITIDAPRNTTGSARTNTIPVTYYNAAGVSIYTDYILIKQEA